MGWAALQSQTTQCGCLIQQVPEEEAAIDAVFEMEAAIEDAMDKNTTDMVALKATQSESLHVDALHCRRCVLLCCGFCVRRLGRACPPAWIDPPADLGTACPSNPACSTQLSVCNPNVRTQAFVPSLSRNLLPLAVDC
jgi:hypothetical protein